MAHHAHQHETFEDAPTVDGAWTFPYRAAGMGMFAIGLVGALLTFWMFGGWRRFFLAYLTAYFFVLTICLGGLIFVMIQHQFRAGWSVNIRRVPEALAANLRWLWVGLVPIILTFFLPGMGGTPTLYPWAYTTNTHHADGDGGATHDQPHEEDADLASAPASAPMPADLITGAAGMDDPVDEAQAEGDAAHAEGEAAHADDEHALAADRPDILTEIAISIEQAKHHTTFDHITEAKTGWLNWPFFTLRMVIYFGVWAYLALFYWNSSRKQDGITDPKAAADLTRHVQWWTPIHIMAFALTLTFAGFDLVMSLDPHFFSTIFGGYLFAGSMVGGISTTILVYLFLRGKGLLVKDVTVEHYHDLGKLLFTFVFFWGYIAFSQFMLIWYANIPETTYWFGVRGATTVQANAYMGPWGDDASQPAGFGWWRIVILTLLFAHLLIPFAALLSRHVKRNLGALAFLSGWMLVMHYVDIYWLIMPEMLVGGWQLLPVVEVACLLMFGGLLIAATSGALANVKLRPTGDPRLPESMHLHQSF